MKTEITARNFHLSVKLRRHIEVELERLEKLYDGIVDCTVILENIKKDRSAEIIMRVYRQTLVIKEVSEDIFKSVDGAAEKLRRRLKKYKHKLRDFDHESLE